MDTLVKDGQSLLQRYEALQQQGKTLRARNAAESLGVSEAELVASRIGLGVTRLRNDAKAILKEVKTLGEVMALTRNEHCVHERKGCYQKIGFNGSMGLAVNEEIDLRLFMHHWSSIFAVEESGRHSLQFFDRSGTAAHKIYLTDASDAAAYRALVSKFSDCPQIEDLALEAYPEPSPPLADSDIDIQGLESAWRALKDTHDFHALLATYKVQREQALRLVSDDLAKPLSTESPRRLLEAARDSQCEIMVFVGNRACIQIHSGPVTNLRATPGWFNVLDPRFNLHLKEDAVAACWLTRKPTVDGVVSALEVYGAGGELIVTFFGRRKPGQPELPLWRELLQTLAD